MNSAASMMTSSSIASDTPTYAAYSAPNSPMAMTPHSPVSPLDFPAGSLTPAEQHQLASKYSQNNAASYNKWMQIFAALGLGAQVEGGAGAH